MYLDAIKTKSDSDNKPNPYCNKSRGALKAKLGISLFHSKYRLLCPERQLGGLHNFGDFAVNRYDRAVALHSGTKLRRRLVSNEESAH